ncbi:MAG: hypothetical protein HKN26_07765 [Acidimicrobiales bacterium]|nr:hypothetical protein [Acidimicrobiales bacterium]
MTQPRRSKGATLPDSAHEWVSFDDSDGDTWVFDLTFLTSNWSCIFGAGCLGINDTPTPELEQGCCSFGAHFTDVEDQQRVAHFAERLTPDQWQLHDQVDGDPFEIDPDADEPDADERGTGAGVPTTLMTKRIDGACCFLNRPGFEGGAGCALHRAALEADERPLDWKPDVCWQLPLRLEHHEDDNGHDTYTLREWKIRDWGSGGADFHWWCTSDDLAFVEHRPVHETLADELRELCGDEPYDLLRQYLAQRAPEQLLPHPVLRRR